MEMKTEERMKLTKTAQRLRRYRETAAAAAVLEEKMAGLRETAAACRRMKTSAAERAHLRASYRQTAMQLSLYRTETRQVERALAELSAEERHVLNDMLIAPVPMAADGLCEKLNVEMATVYRRRKSALKKMAALLE